MKFVTYVRDNEIIITTEDNDEEVRKIYFGEGKIDITNCIRMSHPKSRIAIDISSKIVLD